MSEETKTILSPKADDQTAPVQVVVNQPTVRQADTATELDLVAVFKNMGKSFKIYVWLMVCLAAIGVCVPLVMHQFSRQAETVASVVSLDYMIGTLDAGTGRMSYRPVTDLTAPDGTQLDLDAITSSYVLQKALDVTELSVPVSVANLKSNMTIEKVLSEDSRRQQEVVSKMLEDKNNAAYQEALDFKLQYTNQFVISLKNGFGDEDARKLNYLDTSELKDILDNIITVYNRYLYDTYYAILMPDDEFSKIDLAKLDLLEGADKVSTAVRNLIKYFDDKPEKFLNSRSAKDGLSMKDMSEMVKLIKSTTVDYTYSYILTASLSEDAAQTAMKYNYQLRNLELQLDEINENINTTQSVIETYQNDELSIAMQEGQGTITAQSTTDYYNSLIIRKAELYEERSGVLIEMADLKDRIKALSADSSNDSEALESARMELENMYDVCLNAYNRVYEHAKEMSENDDAVTYVNYTASQGEAVSFLKSCGKKAGIGAAVGLFLGVVVWGCAALGQELGRGYDKREQEAA